MAGLKKSLHLPSAECGSFSIPALTTTTLFEAAAVGRPPRTISRSGLGSPGWPRPAGGLAKLNDHATCRSCSA